MAVKIFFCYAHEDEPLLNQLKSHLRPLQRQGLIDVWHDRDISAGTEWEQEIHKHLNEAQIILLLVSPDFMNSDYCYSIEMKQALERHKRKEVVVIPIILRPIYWEGALGSLQALPTDAKPVTDRYWHSLDAAFFDAAEGIRSVVVKLHSPNQKRENDQTRKESNVTGLAAYDQAFENFLEQTETRLLDKTGTLVIRTEKELFGKKLEVRSHNSYADFDSTQEIEVGRIYTGIVRSLVNFGAFVEFLPGKQGLVRTAQLADYQVNRPEDVVSVGDEISVMLVEIDQQGRVSLSRRAALSGPGVESFDYSPVYHELYISQRRISGYNFYIAVLPNLMPGNYDVEFPYDPQGNTASHKHTVTVTVHAGQVTALDWP